MTAGYEIVVSGKKVLRLTVNGPYLCIFSLSARSRFFFRLFLCTMAKNGTFVERYLQRIHVIKAKIAGLKTDKTSRIYFLFIVKLPAKDCPAMGVYNTFYSRSAGREPKC